MAFRKNTRVERTEVLSADQHQTVQSHLKVAGAKSVADLTEEEREALSEAVRDS